jgi:hypothetical protein
MHERLVASRFLLLDPKGESLVALRGSTTPRERERESKKNAAEER